MAPYCTSTFNTQRWKTREVMIGPVGVGGSHPIRIQSMTTSSTRDVLQTSEQCMRLADQGCEIVRVTVQGIKEADACEGIKNTLIQKGYTIPLVADIHFYPPAAMRVVDFVDKVRINPGNFVDKRASFKIIDYDDSTYAREIEKIEEKFAPLVKKCKLLKRVMRIGTNHGSLSDRIMNRFGDTPSGMVESALEFASICRKYDFHDFLFSMKSSNPQVMIQAYRLLVTAMLERGWNYPLHLGVTEAGEGEDGRVKSAMGIGSLLLDGIGDTVRVSLTEDPWNEIDPCQRLVNLAKSYEGVGIPPFIETYRSIHSFQKRPIEYSKNIPLHKQGNVFVSTTLNHLHSNNFYKSIGCDVKMGRPKLKTLTADGIIVQESIESKQDLHICEILRETGIGIFCNSPSSTGIPLLHIKEALSHLQQSLKQNRFSIDNTLKPSLAVIVTDHSILEWDHLKEIQPDLIFFLPSLSRLHSSRRFFEWMQTAQLTIPVILHFKYECSKEDLIINASAEFGSLLCDGLGEGIWIDSTHDIDFLRELGFSILQSARMRMSKTDFISCPSCGRTLFDLQDVSRRIRNRTSHLPGVKIAIMGCIVNGPGEMADADFGYVGSKPGMIDLYVGKECVEKDISFSEADDRLVDLIRKHGRWKDPLEAPV